MKKFLLLATLLGGVALAGNAQLSFQYQGEDVADGAVINYKGFTTDTYGDTTGYIEYKVDPKIYIVSDETANVNIQVNSNVDVQFCAGGLCVPGKNPLKENVPLKAGVPQNLELDYVDEVYDGSDIDIPAIEMTITAWYTNDASNKITITVKMGGFNTPVETIEANNNSISVSGKTLNYDLSSASQLSVFSLSGKTMINKSVAGAGSISLASLPSGVYVYRLGGKNSKSGKFIIR